MYVETLWWSSDLGLKNYSGASDDDNNYDMNDNDSYDSDDHDVTENKTLYLLRKYKCHLNEYHPEIELPFVTADNK